jgi:hypothetical protein
VARTRVWLLREALRQHGPRGPDEIPGLLDLPYQIIARAERIRVPGKWIVGIQPEIALIR